jgi:hypothetical protein
MQTIEKESPALWITHESEQDITQPGIHTRTRSCSVRAGLTLFALAGASQAGPFVELIRQLLVSNG